MLMQAYGVKNQEIFGPGWLDSVHYDLLAKVPAGATRVQVREMYRNLLADRFKVALHHENRMMTGYALTVAKAGPKLKAYDPADASKPDDPAPSGGKLPIGEDGFQVLRRSSMSRGLITLFRNGRGENAGRQRQACQPGGNAVAAQLDQVVTEETGLTGSYDIAFVWTPDPTQIGGRPVADSPQEASAPESSMFAALEGQLGLKLVPKKVQRDCLSIDHAEKIPTEN